MMRGPIASLCLLVSLFMGVLLANYGYLSLYPSSDSSDSDSEVQTDLLMKRTMGTLLIVFGSLKLVNLRSFVNIFSKYDVVSKRVPSYGYVYPFLEIGLGLSIILEDALYPYYLVIGLMVISLLGVVPTLSKGTSLRCGCMGSLFHIPLSYVTISETIGMMLIILWIEYMVKIM